VRDTNNFVIKVEDNNGFVIAEVTEGIRFKPTPGMVSSISLVPHTARTDVQEITDVELVFTP
jgi:hypothetical protein